MRAPFPDTYPVTAYFALRPKLLGQRRDRAHPYRSRRLAAQLAQLLADIFVEYIHARQHDAVSGATGTANKISSIACGAITPVMMSPWTPSHRSIVTG